MRLFGKNSVMERLRSNPKSILKIHLEQGAAHLSGIRKKATQHGIRVVMVPKSKMLKIGRGKNTQGVMVDVEEFAYTPYDEMLEYALKKNRTLLFLDNLNDPQNLGAIIRSAGCLGHFSIVLPTHDSVSVTESVLRVGSGADNYVQVAKVGNINHAIKLAKEEGFHIAGTVVEGGESLFTYELPHPLGIVVGSEQKGIRDVIQKSLDVKLTIPMHVETVSFNAAHAAAILCYEITKQRNNYKAKQKQP